MTRQMSKLTRINIYLYAESDEEDEEGYSVSVVLTTPRAKSERMQLSCKIRESPSQLGHLYHAARRPRTALAVSTIGEEDRERAQQ